MSTTTFMNMELPTVTQTIGPQWATELNQALEVVDEHDHSNGKGTKIKPAGLDINSTLDFQNNIANNLKTVKFQAQDSVMSGTSNSNSVYSFAGNLYFTNGSGTAVQITSGGSLVAPPGSVDTFQYDSVNSNLSINAGDNFVYLSVDTSASRTINLPSASAVSQGRFYLIKDFSGLSETNNITLNADGSDLIDGQASVTISSNYSTTFIIGDGLGNWSIS